MKLWQTSNSQTLDPMIEKFTIGPDLIWDTYLLPYDCLASSAHAFMLQKKGHLKTTEFQKIKKVLKEIYTQAIEKKFKLENVEDSHSAIEELLTKRLGELGGKIHLGRSRNDQSATAIHLFAKNELLQIQKELLQLIEVLQKLAKKYEQQSMPGYTHTRPAMVNTLGHYFAAFAETLSIDFISVQSAYEAANRCPLGSAAGYGTAVPLDRKLTARLLGFDQMQINTLSAQLGRGQVETTTLGSLVNTTLTLSRISNDLIYFSTPEFNFFTLSDAIATGSSIMPQKKNPDVLEIIRASSGMLIGAHTQTATIVKGIPAGYQRDLQLLKQPFIQGIKLSKHALQALQIVLKNLRVNKKALEKSASDIQLYAADLANELVLQQGLSFREAYRKVKNSYNSVDFKNAPKLDPKLQISTKKSLGMPGNLQLGIAEKWLKSEKQKINSEMKKFNMAMRKIWKL
jgi:argininosuccinate lyase